MLELWRDGRLFGYFRCPAGYTTQEFAQKYNSVYTRGTKSFKAIVLW